MASQVAIDEAFVTQLLLQNHRKRDAHRVASDDGLKRGGLYATIMPNYHNVIDAYSIEIKVFAALC